MNFLDLAKKRQSVRSYDPNHPVEIDKLNYILECARLAPSACNAQPWTFVVVDQPDIREKTTEAIADKTLGMNHFAKNAPIHIIVVEQSANLTSTIGGKIKGKHFPHIDIGIAVEHITLAAAEQGLGTCIIGWFNEKKMRKALSIPDSLRPILAITLGYSTEKERDKKRKKWDDVIRFNTYK